MSRGVLVTGASGGIGRAVAAAFARAGDRVAVHYSTRRAEAERTLAQLPGDGHTLVSGDLADPRQVADLATAADTALGGVDVLATTPRSSPPATPCRPPTTTPGSAPGATPST